MRNNEFTVLPGKSYSSQEVVRMVDGVTQKLKAANDRQKARLDLFLKYLEHVELVEDFIRWSKEQENNAEQSSR